MQRRLLLTLATLTPAALFSSRFLSARTSSIPLPEEYRQRAQQLNQLAASIQSPADAQRLVDFITELFADEIPSVLTRSLRRQIATAEFAAVSDPQKRVPEARVVDAWNAYAETIQAPETFRITVAEVHNLRDAFLATDRLSWDRGQQNIWNVPAIYATQTDGTLAPACRPVEVLRVLWDIANMPDNLKAARERVHQGVLALDLFRQALKRSPSGLVGGRVSSSVSSGNPVEKAERKYVQDRGMASFNNAILVMVNRILA